MERTEQDISGMASKEWATRPEDERFSDVYQLLAHLQHRTVRSKELIRPVETLKAVQVGSDVRLASAKGDAHLTHYSFGQLAAFAGLPAKALRDTIVDWPNKEDAAHWVVEGLNHGLAARRHHSDLKKRIAGDANVLIQLPNGQPEVTVRALTTSHYSRIWDERVIKETAIPLVEQHGFINPPCRDPRSLNTVVPGGLYASDRDMFVLLSPANVKRINMPVPLPGGGLIRSVDSSLGGFDVGGQQMFPFLIIKTSEVGAGSHEYVGGILSGICSNLLLIGVANTFAVNLRHVGEVWERALSHFYQFLTSWTAAGTLEQRLQIQGAMETFVARDLLGAKEWMTRRGYSARAADATLAEIQKDDRTTGIISADPTNLWNIVNAITAGNRAILHQDARMEADQRAGQLMAYAKKLEKPVLVTV